MLRRGFAALIVLCSVSLPCGAEDDVAAQVEEGLREAASFGGRCFHLTARIADLGKPAVPALAKVLVDEESASERRVLAAEALGRIRAPEAAAELRRVSARPDLPKDVRAAVEESLYFHGDTEAIDARIATIATKHRALPIAASGARLHLARTYLATGRFRIAARLLEDLVRSEIEARPEQARRHAYDWACAASLAGDRERALEAGRLALRAEHVDLDWMEKDLDLALLREDETFRLLLGITRVGRGFKGLLRGEKGTAAAAETTETDPGIAEYEALDAAYRKASDSWLAAYGRYWDGYEAWLVQHGMGRSREAADAYVKERGAEPANPAAVWAPRFRSFLEGHLGTALGRRARDRLLRLASDAEDVAEFLRLFLGVLSSDPDDLGVVEAHARTAVTLTWQDSSRREEVRRALERVVSSHPDDPRVAEVRLVLAESLRGDDDAASRAAYAEIVKRHPRTNAASEAASALYEIEHLGAGMTAPDFRATGIDGRAWSLAALRGKVVLLDFWATWCGPCLGELPTIQAIHAEHAGEDLVLLGISLDEDGWELAELLEAEGIGWPQVCDLEGFGGALCKLYAVHAIPRTVLIDREGRIAATYLDGEDLREAVRKLLAPAK